MFHLILNSVFSHILFDDLTVMPQQLVLKVSGFVPSYVIFSRYLFIRMWEDFLALFCMIVEAKQNPSIVVVILGWDVVFFNLFVLRNLVTNHLNLFFKDLNIIEVICPFNSNQFIVHVDSFGQDHLSVVEAA